MGAIKLKSSSSWILLLVWNYLLLDPTKTNPSILVSAWKQCSETDGGGICPDKATCCPTDTPGVSGCVSSKSQDPDGQGRCCSLFRGCAYGYSCTVKATSAEPVCQRDLPDPPKYLNAPETPQYQFCRLPLSQELRHDIQTLQAFPIGEYNLAYYSNFGSILSFRNESSITNIDTVLIIVHGSERNADDYLCAGMSLIQPTESEQRQLGHDDNDDYDVDDGTDHVLVIAPKFAADGDTKERALVDNLLIWAEGGPDVPAGHTWRYGADAMNDGYTANISSYGAMDDLVEYVLETFPNVRHVAVAGHSAGGQFVQRWSLLSGRAFWNPTNNTDSNSRSSNRVQIRAVVANPRSYCYMDGRRIFRDHKQSIFDYPSASDIEECPSYNQWLWGLDDGGDVPCPYRDRALREMDTTLAMAERFRTRHVHYLTGEYDVLRLADRCETFDFQGRNRNQRAKRYFSALRQYFQQQQEGGAPPDEGYSDPPTSNLTHSLHQVAGSPHDHTLMFQSPQGRAAILGGSNWNRLED